MPDLNDLIRDLKDIPKLIREGVERGMLGDSVDIADLNRDQLAKGKDRDGEGLGSYAPLTKKIREKKGLQTGFIDLSFTGKSKNSITVKKQTRNKFDLVSVPRWDESRFPKAIGIAEKNEDKLTRIVTDNIEAVLNTRLT